MLGLGTPGQFPLGGGPFGTATTTIGWFSPLSTPVYAPRRSPAALSPAFFFDPIPLVSFSWFEPLSTPARNPPRSQASLSPAFSWQPAPAPSPSVAWGWYMSLSEPARRRPGLKAGEQQFLAWPSQLRPTPVITGILSALETKDTFLAAGQSWNNAASAEIGVISNTAQPVEIGVVQTGPTGTVASVRISITIV